MNSEFQRVGTTKIFLLSFVLSVFFLLILIIPPAFMPTGIKFSPFRLSVRPFICSYVRSFVIPSRSWNLRPSFALKVLKWCISQQLCIRKHSYLDHSYPGGLAFTP